MNNNNNNNNNNSNINEKVSINLPPQIKCTLLQHPDIVPCNNILEIGVVNCYGKDPILEVA